jgi:uncharacterized OB-fold protein
MGLVERHNKTADLTHWRGKIPVNYVYTAGRAGEKFLRGVLNGELWATKCPSCSVVYLPPRTYCERCFERLEDNYVKVAPQGEVHTFTICHRKMDGSTSNEPVIMAMVRIDDTDGGLVHCLGEVRPEDVYIGMPVEAVFRPKRQRKGSILDIQYFRPWTGEETGK